ncbi:unnamed protein product [Diamesa tonsa]
MLKQRMIIIISVIAVALPFIAAIENCDTPNDLPGHCIMMKDCPVLLAKHNANKDQLTITGWGNEEQHSYSDILLFTQMHFVTLNTCMSMLQNSGIDTKLYKSQICAKVADSMDACIGEIGGPLVGGAETINEHGIAKIKNFQYGIVSVKTGCRLRGALPEVYTSVAYYMEWILNQMDQ